MENDTLFLLVKVRISVTPPPRIYIYVITSGENRYNSRMAIAIGWKAA